MGMQLAAGLMFAQQVAGKAARDGLFLLNYGSRGLPPMIAGAAAFSVLLSLLSGRFLRHWAPRRFVPAALAVSGILQVLECWLLTVNPGLASVLIYLHMAGVGVILLSGFWSMLNEEFDPREAKQRFGRIAAGGTIGGLVGGLAAERTVVWFGGPALMLLLAGLHLVCGAFLALILRKSVASTGVDTPAGGKPSAPAEPHRSPLLRTLGTIVLLGSVGAALLDYVFKVYATDTLGRDSNLLRFFAFFHMGTAVLSFLLQSFASKAALEKLGIGKTILALPATLAGGSFLALLVPSPLAALAARAAEAAVRGSLFRAGYETCYTPVPAIEKRMAKAFIDVASERGGDALGAGIVYLCLVLAGAAAVPWILSIAALVGVASVILCGALDRIYVRALARSLESRAVQVTPDEDLDLTTRSLVRRSPFVRPAAAQMWRSPAPQAEGSPLPPSAPAVTDPVLERLGALRSGSVRQVHLALAEVDGSDPLLALQACLLLGRDEHALLAHTALLRAPARIIGTLTDLLLDSSVDVSVRRRIPRIIGAVPGQRAADALVAGLEDSRFEVRMQCARALVHAAAQTPPPALSPERILAAVERELAIGKVFWERNRTQERDPDDSGPEWLDELLREKAHGSLEYVFTLLSLIYPNAPLMTAFRSMHLEDRHLRGTALEYLEGILPVKTREMLWEILGERPSRAGNRGSAEIMQDLLNSSETVVLHLRRNQPPNLDRDA